VVFDENQGSPPENLEKPRFWGGFGGSDSPLSALATRNSSKFREFSVFFMFSKGFEGFWKGSGFESFRESGLSGFILFLLIKIIYV